MLSTIHDYAIGTAVAAIGLTPDVERELIGIARSYAALVREEPAARRLWVTDRRDYFELWLLIEPTDDDTELRLYGADRPLYDLFPEVDFRTFIINPHDFIRLDLDMILPRDVQEVPLRPE